MRKRKSLRRVLNINVHFYPEVQQPNWGLPDDLNVHKTMISVLIYFFQSRAPPLGQKEKESDLAGACLENKFSESLCN